MIDEITGEDSGVEFLNGISRILRNYGLTDSLHGFNTKVIVADASIVDSDVIQQHLSETSAEPNKIFFRKVLDETLPLSIKEFKFNTLKAIVINANSYPAKSLGITYKIFIESLKFNKEAFKVRNKNLGSRVQTEIVEDINNFLNKPTTGQIIVYIQDKTRLADLIDKIKEIRQDFQYHKDYLEIHANLSEQEKKEINQYKNNVKVVFMTASASRGLSFPKTKHILVDIPRFEIEKNLMEIIQVIYRGRGDKSLDGEDKELIFYISEETIYYSNDSELSLQEGKLSLLNILLILKTSIMTRIKGYGQIGSDNYIMIPIGGKSIFAAGQTFSSKMDSLLKQLRKEYDRRRNEQILQEVYVSLKQLLSSSEIILNPKQSNQSTIISYLELRTSLTDKFLKLVNNSFDSLLDFEVVEPGYINGSVLVVPVIDKTLEENYKIRLGQELISYENGELLNKMYDISRSHKFPENLRSAIREAINLVTLLNEKPNKTQIFEQQSHHFDQYYALPLFTFISHEALSEYFNSNSEEPEDQRFRDILATYIQSVYPVANILPIGHKYKDFPFVLFRSYSLDEMRKKIFTGNYLLTSNELNVLNLILAKDS
ncbi:MULTISPECIES: helicase-related protein [unclassified Calothrix]|uniref:helicase-related protein n=1 Tax=unclassified Calothrix TaxID=2619626 RepID=UPI002795E7D5|nr:MULTISPECIES: helicase-related protein [unclassified Calothrix]